MTKINQWSLVQRVKAPTPKLFKVIRTVGLVLATVGGAILAAPAMPVLLVSVAGYLTVAGTVMTAVSQVTVEGE
jgi:ABC-type xylose transport system permease subunit